MTPHDGDPEMETTRTSLLGVVVLDHRLLQRPQSDTRQAFS